MLLTISDGFFKKSLRGKYDVAISSKKAIPMLSFIWRHFRVIDTLGNNIEKIHAFNKDWSKWLTKG
jgi:stress-induced morphogen